MIKLFTLIVSVMFSSIAFAADYQEKCGAITNTACLYDGRYHLVYETGPTGNVITGNADDLNKLSQSGAEIKIVLPQQSVSAGSATLALNGNEKCQQVYKSSSGVIYCLTSLRFSGEATQSVGHGSARYGSDGKLFCNDSKTSGVNGCDLKVSIKWYAKF